MPRQRPLVVYQGNTEQVDVTITLDGAAYDLTGAVVECYLKPDKGTADNDGTVTLLTTTGSDGVEITDAGAGTATITIPSAALATAGVHWWRVDVTEGGARRTALYGELHVKDV